MKFDDHLDIERALVIAAHPDDAEFGSAGTAATWAGRGVEVVYCMVTNGASGSNDVGMTRARLREIREAEQREAASILGVSEVAFLGFEDGCLEPSLQVRKAIAREIRRRRPDAVITQDPRVRILASAYVNHPDHIAVGEAVLRSVNPDASTRLMFPELWTEEGLEPHKPKALFLVQFVEGNTYVDISEAMDLKVKALLAHRSQVSDFPVEDFIRGRNQAIGRQAGCEYAEAFDLVRLEF
ncbi:MAG: PIG-L family deacetylase [Acidobacteria bacterium]|nr:PIG-L family deacetylase [Acidobacteriota bacterium]